MIAAQKPNPPVSPGKPTASRLPTADAAGGSGSGTGVVQAYGGSTPKLYRPVDWLTFIITTLMVLGGYLYTISPDLTLEDCGELAVGSMYAGVPHPPGYPVWTIYTWLFTKLIPFSNISFRVSVASAVASSVSAGLVGLLISRGSSMILEGIDSFKTLERRWENPICVVSGLVGGLLLGFNGYIWSQSVIVEVYTLAVLTLMAVLAFLLRWIHAPHQRRYLYLAFFFFGLCFCNHQTLIVAAMGLEIAVLAADRRLGRYFFICNVLVFTYVALGRAFGFSGILADNPGVYLIFTAVGLGSSVTVFAFNGKIPATVRNYAVIGLAVVSALLALLHFWSVSSVMELNMKAGQAVAAGQSAEGYLREIKAAEIGASTWLMILALFSTALLITHLWVAVSTGENRSLGARGANFGTVFIAGLCFLAGAAFYFYMPIASMTNPPMNWGYPRTWEGFIHAFTRGQYEKTNPSLDPVRLLSQIVMYAQGCAEEFNWANMLIAFIPFFYFAKMKRREQAWIVGLTGIYFCLAILLLILLNPGLDLQSKKLVKVFFTSSHVVIALLMGYGLSIIGALLLTRYHETRKWMLVGGAVLVLSNLYDAYVTSLETNMLTNRIGPIVSVAISVLFCLSMLLFRERVRLSAILTLFALIPADSILSHWADNEQRGHLFGYWFGHDMFTPPFKGKDGKPLYPEMARDAVLYGGTDPGRFCPTYMIFCESFIPPNCRRDPDFDRRDVCLITQNALADNTYLDYIRAHYNRSAQIDPPFFLGMLNDKNSAARGRTNFLASLASPLDRYFTDLGAKIEKQRRAGSSYFRVSDFKDLTALKAKISAGGSPLSAYLKQQIGTEALSGDGTALAKALNTLIEGPSLYDDPKRFEEVRLTDRLKAFAIQNPPTANRIRLNRLLLEAAYPQSIATSAGGLYPDREIQSATPDDAKKCFDDYTADAARRYQLNQLDQGEQVNQLPDGRISVSGQVAVMAINGLITKVIFDKNPDHEFYIEESFPLKWMYPHLTPYGIIMKIERNPVAELTDQQIATDHEFWSQFSDRLIGNWITYDTSMKDVCDFVLKTYSLHDLNGFKGDPKFVRDDNAQKAFSKLRNAIGKSVYNWRAQTATNPVSQQKYLKEAEFALKQAFAFCPFSPETVFNLAILLAQLNRTEDALLVAKTCQIFDPANLGIRDLVRGLEGSRNSPAGMGGANSGKGIGKPSPQAATNLSSLFQIAADYLQAGRSNEAVALMDGMANSLTDAPSMLQIAEGYRVIGRPDRAELTMRRVTQVAPELPEGWFNLALLEISTGETNTAASNLQKALILSDARLKQAPTSPNLRSIVESDVRYKPVKALLK